MNTNSILPYPQLCTDRLQLRPLCEADLAAFAAYRSEPAVAAFQSWSHYSLDQARALLQDQQNKPFGQEGEWYQIAIACKASDALYGDLALHVIDADQIEVGFTLAPGSQGRGLAGEALRCLLDWYFVNQGGHRAIAVTDARNQAAARLLSRLGFRQEAHFRQNVFFKGAWGDEWLFACLASEWRGGDGTDA